MCSIDIEVSKRKEVGHVLSDIHIGEVMKQ